MAILAFDAEIDKVLLVNNALFVMTDTNENIGNCNIFRVSEFGKIIWQIQEPQKYLGADAWRSVAFAYLGVNEKGAVVGGSLNCFNYEIDFETGKLLNPVFTK